jgi:hypothetical protein
MQTELETKLQNMAHDCDDEIEAEGIQRALNVVREHVPSGQLPADVRDELNGIISHAHTLDLATTRVAELRGDPDICGLSHQMMKHVQSLKRFQEGLEPGGVENDE